MGLCTIRPFLLTICVLQLVSTIERQVFDFLGYMWAPILANFFNIIFVIFGFYGAFQFRPKYIITYTVWCVLWAGWNTFVICFYLSVGILNKDSDVLNLGTGSVSWWEVNGAGCRPIYPTNLTVDDPYPFRPLRPDKVMDCVLDYKYVETFHAALQCLLAMLGGVGGVLASQVSLCRDRNFNFLDDFESNKPEHLALHPMSVPSTGLGTSISYVPAWNTKHSHNKHIMNHVKVSPYDKIRSYRSDSDMNYLGGSHNNFKAIQQLKQVRALQQNRPKSLYLRDDVKYM